jgi:fluoroacetyl-CoA thioesterase
VNTLFPESSEFSRKPAVLATGILVALCEWPAMDALRQFIGDDEDSLGTGVSISHRLPVCIGTKLAVTARCINVAGRASRWDVGVFDGPRTVACGWAEFAVVHTAAFLERHMLEPAAAPMFRRLRRQLGQHCAQDDRDLVAACGRGSGSPMARV